MNANSLLTRPSLLGRSSIGACLLAVSICFTAPAALAQKMVVMEARGGGVKVGESIDGARALTLKEGERVTLIGPDGKTVSRRGPYSGPAAPPAAGESDPKAALAALVATRNARTSSIGVVRAGTDSVKVPNPWYVDVTRSGPRCLQEGHQPALWRPTADAAQSFVMFPSDRSWRADFTWKKGENAVQMPPLSRFEGVTTVLVNIDQQEFAITINIIPKDIDSTAVLTAWMLEKGCIQQADALLQILSAQTGANVQR
jgi:hypothetical protein